MDTKRFTVRECGRGPIILGLERVTADNALVLRLVTDKPLAALDVGEVTIGRAGRDGCEVVREADSGMTQERARYILASQKYGELRFAFHRASMSDTVYPDGITPDENAAIEEVWRRLPGWSCYADAVAAIAYPERWPSAAAGT